MASDDILDIKLSYTFMGGAREGVGAVGAVGLKLFRRRLWQHANFKRGRDSGLGRGGILENPPKTFKDKLFGAHKKVSEKVWRLRVQKN
jgi:hypothetical protein